MASLSGPSIAQHVNVCLTRLKEVRRHSLESEEQERLLEESLARFKIWTNNIGAHRKGDSSLDYRLRDASHLKEQVISLLDDIQRGLSDLEAILTGEKTPWDRQLEDDSSEGEEEAVLFNKSQPQVLDSVATFDSTALNQGLSGSTEADQILGHLIDCVRCLLRLSIAIKHPAPPNNMSLQVMSLDVHYAKLCFLMLLFFKNMSHIIKSSWRYSWFQLKIKSQMISMMIKISMSQGIMEKQFGTRVQSVAVK